MAAIPYAPSGETSSAEFPTLLVTGRRLEHYNAGTMTRRTDNLELMPEELIQIHPEDASDLGVATGDRVRVASRRGEIELAAELTDRVSPGQAFMAFHFPEALANRLTSQAVDTVTSCPEYKVTAVQIERAAT